MPSAVEILGGEAKGVFIALIEKSASTSILQSVKGSPHEGRGWDIQHMRDTKKPMRVYLRHPLRRLRSAWAFFAPARFPVRHIEPHTPYERFVDQVLDHCARNVHWNPVLEMLEGCNIAEIYRLEDIAETWPADIKLLRLNASRPHTPVNEEYRLGDLEHFYREDFDAWRHLRPT